MILRRYRDNLREAQDSYGIINFLDYPQVNLV
jgi:hypothetical protein